MAIPVKHLVLLRKCAWRQAGRTGHDVVFHKQGEETGSNTSARSLERRLELPQYHRPAELTGRTARRPGSSS